MLIRGAAAALTAVLLAAAVAPASAQQSEPPQERPLQKLPLSDEARRQRLALALAAAEYPVTPGDTYRLSFLPAIAARTDAAARVNETVVVAGDYTVDLGAFGALDGRGLNLNELRRSVAARVADAYPGSNPALRLTEVGTFEVHLRGAVETSGHTATWGLGRLSDVVAERLSAHASVRDLRVERGADVLAFDLFRAQRFGNRSQDPYLLPGDRICVSRHERAVRINGQVWRPGSYQLAAGEGLAELVAFAGGFTPWADPERVRIESLGAAPEALPETAEPILDCEGAPLPAASTYPAAAPGATRYAAWDAELAAVALRDGDVVTIANRDALLPAVFFEGAVVEPMVETSATDTAAEATATGAESGARIAHRYRPGETLFDALQQNLDAIAPAADLANATLVRRGEPDDAIDLELLLHGGARAGDRPLQPGDRIVIPAQRFEVALRGEVSEARQLTVTPVTRLHDVVTQVRTPYTSLRRIAVAPPRGPQRTYDLFRWLRFGELAHNPLLTPGAAITFHAREREVRLSGEVRRPGRYQLLPGEGLEELIEQYGDGFTAAANPGRVVLTRPHTPGGAREAIAVDFRTDAGPPLLDGDEVVVRPRPAPVVYVEGGLRPPAATTVTTTRSGAEEDQVMTATERALVPDTPVTGTTRRAVPYWPGVTVFDVLFPLRGDVRQDADLETGYVVRAGTRLRLNLQALLFGGERDRDLPLQPYDTIVVPVRRFSVTVAGAVQSPGVYAYLPGRPAGYYVRLAGGSAAAAGGARAVTVTDGLGREKDPQAPVAPDDQISVAADNLLFTRVLAPAATLGALVISFVALILALDS